MSCNHLDGGSSWLVAAIFIFRQAALTVLAQQLLTTFQRCTGATMPLSFKKILSLSADVLFDWIIWLTVLPVQPRTVAGFRGTVRYASVNAHKNKVSCIIIVAWYALCVFLTTPFSSCPPGNGSTWRPVVAVLHVGWVRRWTVAMAEDQR